MEGKGRKRQRTDNALSKAYQGVRFTPVAATGRPGTPHRYFKESYTVEFDGDSDDKSQQQRQVVHAHVNGLAIVTAGTFSKDDLVKSIDVVAQVSDVAHQSAGSKRKQTAKMLKGKAVADAVSPTDRLATIQLDDGEISLRCCVWGSLLEINPNLTPARMQEDPLLDGYVAVILPSGPFPPLETETNADATDEHEDKKMAASVETTETS